MPQKSFTRRKFTAPLILILAIMLFAGYMPSPVRAQEPTSPPARLTIEQARQAALDRLQTQAAWAQAKLGQPILLYDLSGETTAFLFPVTQNEQPAGYLTVAGLALPNPVLEFATEGGTPLDGSLMQIAARGEQPSDTSRPLYLGLLGYGYELQHVEAGYRRVLTLMDGDIMTASDATAAIPLSQQISPEWIFPQDDDISIMAYSLISGVADWDQFWGSYGCYSGCSPTSAVNVMGYWDSHGYDNLIGGSDWTGAVDDMRSRMNTVCDGTIGSTYLGDISPGIVSYVQARGYSFSSEIWADGYPTTPTYDRYRAEIDAGRPLVVDVYQHNYYGDHSITGVGYETDGSYMIVHDNWSSTGENVYLQYGSGYSNIYMHPVAPGSTPTDEVKLWSLANYAGDIVWHGSSDSNDPNADSYSMEVPAGWSVKVYDQDNYSGSERCWNSSVNNLQDHGWHLRIRSIRVYQSDVCLAPPPAPSYVTATDGTYSDRVYVDWPAVSGATYYEVYRATSSTGTKTNLSSPTSSYYSDYSATAGITYYYWVRACNSAGCSDYSGYNTGYRSVAAPSAPSYVTATDGTYTDRVYVDWPSVSGATSYEVWRATSSGGTKTRVSSPTSSYYNDTSATAGTTYYYWVKACNSGGCSDYSGYNTGYRSVADSPVLAYSGLTVDDDTGGNSIGNDDGVAACGEDIELWVYLENSGAGVATGVSVDISTTDPYVTWLYNTSSTYRDIATGEPYVYNDNDFDFSLSANTPPEHNIRFNLNIYADGGYATTDYFDLPTVCVPLDSVVINEIEVGNSDWVELYNTGNQAVTMTGWQLNAYGSFNTTYTFPNFTLQPGAYVLVHESSGTNSATELFTGVNSFPWVYDDSGAVSLTTGNGVGVDFVRWGGSTVLPPYGTGWTGVNPIPPADGETLVRVNAVDTDDGSDWGISAPSPGLPNEQNSVYLPLILR